MQLTAYSLVFFGLLAVIPALVVAVIVTLRIESVRVTIVTINHGLTNLRADFERSKNDSISLLGEFDKIQRKLADLDADLHGQRLKCVNLEESISSVSNKMNSRERIERKNQRREEEEEKQTAEIPGTEQQVIPLFPPSNAGATYKQQRKFGQMP
jgi:chromosome segregation ATPase